MKRWLPEKQIVFIAKALAIIAVVILHTLSLFDDSIYFNFPYKHLSISLNQSLRFSVPLFLSLSGFGLAKKYQHKTLAKKKFILARAKKILPLYFLWSLLLFVLLNLSRTWSSGIEAGFIQSLILGQADYHFYFIFLIFQFYFLFSIFGSKTASSPLLKRLIGLSAIIQFGWFLLLRYLIVKQIPIGRYLISDQIQYRLIINWIFYFFFGVFLAQTNLKPLKTNPKASLILIAACIASLFWSIYDSHLLLARTGDIVFATSFIRIPVFLYSISFTSIIIIYGKSLFSKKLFLSKILSKVGQYSYIIYLSHTLILRIIEGFVKTGPRVTTLTRASTVLIVGTVISVIEVG